MPANYPVCCPFCSFRFDGISSLCSHLREMHSLDPEGHGSTEIGCPFCVVQAAQQHLLNPLQMAEHLWHCHPEAATSSSTSLPASSDGRRRSQRRSTYACKFCARHFPNIVDLRRHERTHTGERPFGCEECGSSFKLKQTLEHHQRTHRTVQREEQWSCTICEKNFLSRAALRLHLRIHTGERPFPCVQPECPMAFRTKKLMLTHQRKEHQNAGENSHLRKGDSPECAFDEDGEEHRIMALDGLLKLNPRIGPRRKSRKAASLGPSEHSAFSKFSRNAGRRRAEQGLKLDGQIGQSVQNGTGQQQPEPRGSLPPGCGTSSHSSHLQMLPGDDPCNPQSQPQNVPNPAANFPANLHFLRLPPQQQAQVPPHQQQHQYFFQTADAEYTRQGQVHCRRDGPPPSHQFRTLTPPTFVYYFNEVAATVEQGQQDGSFQQQQQQSFPPPPQ